MEDSLIKIYVFYDKNCMRCLYKDIQIYLLHEWCHRFWEVGLAKNFQHFIVYNVYFPHYTKIYFKTITLKQ